MGNFSADESGLAPKQCPNCHSHKLTVDSRARYRLVRYSGTLRWRLDEAWDRFDEDGTLRCIACGHSAFLEDLPRGEPDEQYDEIIEQEQSEHDEQEPTEEELDRHMDYLTS